jgi:alkaline phosphatase D
MRDPVDEVASRSYLQKLLRATSVYAVWDDHEVINNFDRTNALMPAGREAFFRYWPIDSHPLVTGTRSHRLYRSFRWGNHLELFIIDTRQYRDPNRDVEEDKTMLGEAQRNWLKDSLASSDATFKVIASSTTMGIESGDGWTNSGNGYENELYDLFNHISSEEIKNVIVTSGDIHTAQVASFDSNGDVVRDFIEASAGPIGAPGPTPKEYHEPFNPLSFFERGNDFYNFGVLQVDEQGKHIWVEIRHENGKIAFSRKFNAA